MRNWGAYIKNLNASGADKKITGLLDHIRDNFRNPVFHPEETLSSEEAQVLLGVCTSAIVMMVNAMKQLEEKAALNALAGEAGLAVLSGDEPTVSDDSET